MSMSRIKKVFYYLFHPNQLIKRQQMLALDKNKEKMSDEEYIKKAFKIQVGYSLNLDNPKSFDEKLQWLKLHDRKPIRVIQTDKYLVREYVKKIVGDKYLIPLLGVWDDPDEIDFKMLPNQFVLKCNHNSGTGMFICKDKNKLTENDYNYIVRNLKKGLNEDYFLKGREWPYKNIERKVIAEQYLGDGDGTGILDYKFYCFDGVPKCLLIATNRAIDVRFDYFDIDLTPFPFEQGGKRGFYKPTQIKNYDKMLLIAKKLSNGIPHVRIDLYNIDGAIYFGEMTFFDSSGFAVFKPRKWDYIFGEWLKLPEETN